MHPWKKHFLLNYKTSMRTRSYTPQVLETLAPPCWDYYGSEKFRMALEINASDPDGDPIHFYKTAGLDGISLI